MSEMQPPSGDDLGPPTTPPHANQPVEGPSRATRPPLPPERQQMVWPSFAAGFMAPVVASALGYAAGVVIQAPEALGAVAGIAVFVALLFAIDAGKANSDDGLRSLGLGGLATLLIPGLGMLLLFGTCVMNPIY